MKTIEEIYQEMLACFAEETGMELAGTGDWLEGQRFSGSVSDEELRAWIEGLS